ncbi:hypothetical protein MNB_SUP05-5-959 [hydrothermal vent metagenome]|uniref:Lipoprotein n=1 Tax=hydrothermal vent metagenome TaxID=652676 RepID=A0A1W1CE15_9ZZZZ
MHKIILITVISLFFLGCSESATQSYRPVDQKKAWNIYGKYNGFTGNVQIFINGYKAIDEGMDFFSSHKDLNGFYNDRKIQASCSESIYTLSPSVECIIFVDNERAATLIL